MVACGSDCLCPGPQPSVTCLSLCPQRPDTVDSVLSSRENLGKRPNSVLAFPRSVLSSIGSSTHGHPCRPVDGIGRCFAPEFSSSCSIQCSSLLLALSVFQQMSLLHALSVVKLKNSRHLEYSFLKKNNYSWLPGNPLIASHQPQSLHVSVKFFSSTRLSSTFQPFL